jgi:hypothetical protein
MIDLRQRLRELDQLEAPDMRADIEQRISSQAATTLEPLRPELRPRSPQWRGPLVAAATAAAILLVVVIAAITALRSEPTSTVVPAATIAPTDISVDSTMISAADPWDGVIEVTFDGRECVVTGPTSVPAGLGRPFVLTNTSGTLVDLGVGSLRGTSSSEFMDLQRAADGFVYEDYEDLHAIYTWLDVRREALSFDPEERPAIDLAENQTLEVRSLTFGTDIIYLITNAASNLPEPGSAKDGLVSPEGYWFCGQLNVTAIEF